MTMIIDRPKPKLPIPMSDRFPRSQFADGTSPADPDPDGGKNGAGLIEGVSIATRGTALGHGVWLDSVTLEQIVEFAAAQSEKGLKSRFCHPSLCADGMGRFLGRIHDVEMSYDGSQVLGNLHFSQTAHNTPDGDLAEYVMGLAEEDPAAAGLSIVFDYDKPAMIEFALENGAEWKKDRSGAEYLDWDGFQSPDELNIENLPHVRMKALRGADVVDEPAANEDGLFDRDSTPRDADRFLSFAIGLSEHRPEKFLGVDPDRAREYLSRWLSGRGLSISAIDKEPETMSATTSDQNSNPSPPETPTPEPTRADFAAELGRFTAAFGDENGSKWFQEGITFEQGQERHSAALSAENETLREQLAAEQEKLSSLSLGEEEPIDVGAGEPTKDRVKFSDFFASSSKN